MNGGRIVPYQFPRAAEAVASWNRALGAAFPMRLSLWRQRMEGDPNFHQIVGGASGRDRAAGNPSNLPETETGRTAGERRPGEVSLTRGPCLRGRLDSPDDVLWSLGFPPLEKLSPHLERAKRVNHRRGFQ